MKILITGSKGFIGKNLIFYLKEKGYNDLYLYDRETNPELLKQYTADCEFVFHLAGVNRPVKSEDFIGGNFNFTKELLGYLSKNKNKSPIVLASSIQATQDNEYGISKKLGEDYLIQYGKSNHIPICIYRFPNVFGKWTKPNYNSVVATFCHNIARDLPIVINNRETLLRLVYIDDVVKSLANLLDLELSHSDIFYNVEPVYEEKLGDIADLIYSFKMIGTNIQIPFVGDLFVKKMYSTYLSYLPLNQFSYDLTTYIDDRGAFAEAFRSETAGQISINTIKPNITKGNHWHHTKIEKFIILTGEAIIKFRHIVTNEMIEYPVSGTKLEVVDIPPGYAHNITNIGENDVVLIIWANECYDRTNPDTNFLEV